MELEIEDFDGLLVVGDIHSSIVQFNDAVDYATSENLFVVSLGDLVDRGPNPFEVVELMHSLVKERRGILTIGNHDRRFIQIAQGHKVHLPNTAQKTVELVGTNIDRFYDFYLDLAESGDFWNSCGNLHFTHARWDENMVGNNFNQALINEAMYGIRTGERDIDGYGLLDITWIDRVPTHHTCFVGHSNIPFGSYIKIPKIYINANLGRTVFVDTGCGKNGSLSSIHVSKDGHILKAITYGT